MFIILLVIFQLLYIFIYFIFRKKSRFIKILIYVILALNIVFFLLSKNTVNYLYYLKYTFFSINLSIFIYILSTFINQNKKDKLFKNINIFIDKY